MYSKTYVEITNICNMNCSFCHGHKRTPRQMSAEEFSFILSALTDKTKYIYYHLMGEPLTHPQLHEFIQMAGERGFKSVVTTNGTLLKKRGEELLSAGLYKVNLSVHSFEGENDDEHLKYIRELVEFSEKAAKEGTIVVFRMWNNGFDAGRNETTFNLLKELIQGEWAENTRGIRIRDKIHIEWGDRFEWPDSEAEIKGDRFFCYGLKDHFGILSDGTVVPCCLDSDGIINLGNVFTESLDTILNSDRAKAIADGFAKGETSEDLCKRCGYAQRFIK